MEKQPILAAIVLLSLAICGTTSHAAPPQAGSATVQKVDFRGKPPFKRSRANAPQSEAAMTGSGRFRGHPPFNRVAVRAGSKQDTAATSAPKKQKRLRRRGAPGKTLPR
jgi:hypothetical protein